MIQSSLRNSLITIANRAAPLACYLGKPLSPSITGPALTDKSLQKILAHWRETVAGNEPDLFDRRLLAAGLDEAEALRRLVVSLYGPGAGELPAWTGWLQELFEGPAAYFEPAPAPALPDRKVVAFQEVLQPFINLYRHKLVRLAGNNLEILTREVLEKLERDLLEALSELAGPALAVEFAAYKAQNQPGGFLALFNPPAANRPTGDDKSDPAPVKLYRGFVKGLLDNRLENFFLEYSSLARLLCLKTGFFLDALVEFLARLHADLSEIEQVFGRTGGKITGLTGGLSDPHNGGRSVFGVEFSFGLKLIYKPRNLALEAAFQDFIKWSNQRLLAPGGELPLKTINYLAREGYGWVEFVEHLPCRDALEIRNYYRRCGSLLAILYLLQAKDYHYENLIACGEFPVPVDQEALLSPVPGSPGGASVSEPVARYYKSVLSTGILPTWEVTASGHIRDTGALGDASENDRAYLKKGWQDVNTDRMRAVPLKSFDGDRTGLNRPFLDGEAVPVDAFVTDFSAGFEKTYRLLLAAKEDLLSSSGPLQPFRGLRGRAILRPTRVYGTLLHEGAKPGLLAEGRKRSIHFDRLSKAFLVEGTNPDHWPILTAELKSLEQLDLPFFACTTTSTALLVEGQPPIENYFARSGFEAVMDTVNDLGESDLQQQLGYIRASFYMVGAGTTREPGPVRSVAAGKSTPGFTPDPAHLVEEACKIGRELAQNGIWSGESLGWLFTGYDKRIERFQITPVDYSLYSGQAGPALFLAALAAATGERQFQKYARAAWQPYFDYFSDKQSCREFIRAEGIGGAVGLGSIIYALTLSAGSLNDTALTGLALTLVDQIRPEFIEADRKFDLVFGSAGLLVSLLALYESSHEEKCLQIARQCGIHLLQTRQVAPGGRRAWVTLDRKYGTGFSHGSAGIAYALLRLYALVGGEEYREAASETIEYEDSLFSAQAGNWPYLFYQPEGAETYWSRWCHGAPGIGLGRLGGLTALDTPAIRADIEAALRTTRHEGLLEIDHLCCGNFGLLELQISAAGILNRPDLLEAARQMTATMIDRANTGFAGRFCIFPGNPAGLYSPAFFQGNSGIGYELLRLADPTRFPAVLLWQSQSQEKNNV